MENKYIYSTEHAGLEKERYSDPCIMVIFGASGDLTKRKLMPALFNLYRNGFLAEGSKILGTARAFNDHENFRRHMKESIEEFGSKDERNDPDWEDFSKLLYFYNTDVTDPASYSILKKEIEEHEKEGFSCGNRLFYFAMPPELYDDIVINLAKCGLNKPANSDSWTRIVVEKPFGRDLDSAQKLDSLIAKYFK